MQTLCFLEDGKRIDRMILPRTPNVVRAVVESVIQKRCNVSRVGLSFESFDIILMPSQLTDFSAEVFLRYGYRGTVLIELSDDADGKDRLLSSIMEISVASNADMIDTIRSLSGEGRPKREMTRQEYERSERLSALLKAFYGHQCMICRGFILTDDAPFTETHHMVPLEENGLDSAENIAVVCPNCHATAHYGCAKDKKEIWRLFRERNPFLKKCS